MEDDHEISGNNRTDIIVVVDVRLDASRAGVHTHADAQPVHCEVAHNLFTCILYIVDFLWSTLAREKQK